MKDILSDLTQAKALIEEVIVMIPKLGVAGEDGRHLVKTSDVNTKTASITRLTAGIRGKLASHNKAKAPKSKRTK